jgi:hypothetical protein
MSKIIITFENTYYIRDICPETTGISKNEIIANFYHSFLKIFLKDKIKNARNL